VNRFDFKDCTIVGSARITIVVSTALIRVPSRTTSNTRLFLFMGHSLKPLVKKISRARFQFDYKSRDS